VSALPFLTGLTGGGTLRLDQDDVDPKRLLVTLTTQPVAIAGAITRDEVQELAQALDDWLYDSRPT
jgi:hypothetical protein